MRFFPTVLAVGALLAVPLAPAQADVATVKGVSYDASREMLIIKGDGVMRPHVTRLEGPSRLVIDLPGTHLDRAYQQLGAIAGTSVTRVRVGQYLASTTRVVLDLSGPANFQAVASGFDVLVPLKGGQVAASPAQAAPVAAAVAAQVEDADTPVMQAIVYHQGDLTFAMSRRAPYWSHTVPGNPYRYIVVFPKTRLAPELLGGAHPVNAAGIMRWRATQVGDAARIDFDLSKAPSFDIEAGTGGWHFYTDRAQTAARVVTPGPVKTPQAVRKPSPAPIRLAVATPPPLRSIPATVTRATGVAEWTGPTDAPLALRKVGDQWQLLVTGQGRFRYDTTAVGDDRLHVDIIGSKVSLPRDSVYIDGGLIARVRVNPGANGNQRLTIDLDQPVRHSSRMLPNQKSLLLSLSRVGKSRVTVDPGHGGTDNGAMGSHGVREKDVTLAIATRLARVMQTNGMSVQMTRMKDLEILLRPRVELANHNDSDVFISIHANSFGSHHGVAGIETYYFSDESYELAKSIHRQLLKTLKQPDRGVRKNNFYVVHHTQMPAALVEIGYLSNPQEEALLASAAYQEKAAGAIYAGIKEFLNDRKQKP